jgi:hypothetical protein
MPRTLLATLALLLVVFAPDRARADLPGEGYKNHLVFSLGIGVDAIHPTDYDAYTNAFDVSAGGQSGQINPSVAIRVPLLATYYAPYYILVRTGVDADYFFPSSKIGNDTVTNYGGTLEVPLMVGGHYALADNRLILELALGPCVSAFTAAGLNGGNGSLSYQQLYADPSFGFDSEIKAQYFLSPGFSLGIELGYRVLSSSDLHASGAKSYYQPPFPPYTSPGAKPIHLDLSGFRAAFELGFAAL